jgi:hypothetical protein
MIIISEQLSCYIMSNNGDSTVDISRINIPKLKGLHFSHMSHDYYDYIPQHACICTTLIIIYII